MATRRDNLARRRQALGYTQASLADTIGVSRVTIYRWETGASDPRSPLRHQLARSLHLSLDELDELLEPDNESGFSGSVDTQGGSEVRRRDFIQASLAVGLTAAAPPLLPLFESTDALDRLQHGVDRLSRLEQRSQYGAISALLPAVVADARQCHTDARGIETRQLRTAKLLGEALQLEAWVMIKHGRTTDAQASANRALTLFQEANDPLATAAALRCLGETYMRADDFELAADLALASAEHVGSTGDRGPLAIAIQGAGFLSAAMAMARAGQRDHALELANHAATLSDQLRHDYIGHVIFGPTNVAIHTVAIEVELGDPTAALRNARNYTVRNRPGLQERHARYLIDIARANVMTGAGAEAVEALLQAETMSPEEVRTHRYSRAVIQHLVETATTGISMDLRPLAKRSGIDT